eukprot:8312696-Alexandrium_andersonii.AAC.1
MPAALASPASSSSQESGAGLRDPVATTSCGRARRRSSSRPIPPSLEGGGAGAAGGSGPLRSRRGCPAPGFSRRPGE